MKVFKTSGVCARNISYKIEEGKLKNVNFDGGCSGNTSGLSVLLEGMDVDDVISRLEGLDCGARGTSCPDQLAKALKMSFEK